MMRGRPDERCKRSMRGLEVGRRTFLVTAVAGSWVRSRRKRNPRLRDRSSRRRSARCRRSIRSLPTATAASRYCGGPRGRPLPRRRLAAWGHRDGAARAVEAGARDLALGCPAFWPPGMIFVAPTYRSRDVDLRVPRR